MGRIESKLKEMGIELPPPLVLPSANRTSAVLVGTMLYVSGHGAALLEDETVRASRQGRPGHHRGGGLLPRPAPWRSR